MRDARARCSWTDEAHACANEQLKTTPFDRDFAANQAKHCYEIQRVPQVSG